MRSTHLPLLLGCFAAGLSACSDDDRPMAPHPVPVTGGPTSPGAVIEGLERALEERDPDAYASFLADDFIFDVAAGVDAPFSRLTRLEDEAAVRAMLAAASSVTVGFSYDDPVPSGHPDYPADDGFEMIEAVVALDVLMPVQGGEPVLFRVAGDALRFVFRPVVDDGPVTWSLVHLADLHVTRVRTGNTSLSELKILFLPRPVAGIEFPPPLGPR